MNSYYLLHLQGKIAGFVELEPKQGITSIGFLTRPFQTAYQKAVFDKLLDPIR